MRHDDRHLAAARVDRAGDVGVGALRLDDPEILRSLEGLEQRLALLAALAVEHADRHVLDVEVHPVAEQRHLHQRHQEHDHEAARIAQDLDDLLPGDRPDAAQSHGARLSAAFADELDEHVLERRLDRLDPRPGELALGEALFDRRPVARRVVDDDVERRAERRDVARARRVRERLEHRAGVVALDQQDLAADRAALELRRAAERDETAAVDQRDAIAVLGFVHVVRGDDDGDAALRERIDQVPEPPARGRVDARGRLVEEQDRRLVQHRAAERQALLPAAGKIVDDRVFPALQVPPCRRRRRAAPSAARPSRRKRRRRSSGSPSPTGRRRARTSATCSR